MNSTESVRDAPPPATSTFSVLGVPLMTAFHRSTGIGMEFQSGTILLLALPLVVGTAAALYLIVRERDN